MGGWDLGGLLSHPVSSMLIKASLVLVVGLVVNALLARSTAGTRHLVLAATLAGVLLLPVIVFLMPALELAWLPAETVASSAAVTEANDLSPNPSSIPPATNPAQRTDAMPVSTDATTRSAAAPGEVLPSMGPLWLAVAIGLYLLGVIVILAGPLVGVFRLWRNRCRQSGALGFISHRNILSGCRTLRAPGR